MKLQLGSCDRICHKPMLWWSHKQTSPHTPAGSPGSIDWVIMRLVKVGARISYHARYWHVHIASAFALRHHYRAVLGCKTWAGIILQTDSKIPTGLVCLKYTKYGNLEDLVAVSVGRWAVSSQVRPFKPRQMNKKWEQGCGKAFWRLLPHNLE